MYEITNLETGEILQSESPLDLLLRVADSESNSWKWRDVWADDETRISDHHNAMVWLCGQIESDRCHDQGYLSRHDNKRLCEWI